MNIFYLDELTDRCAQYHHDVHLRKMIVEYAQLLSTAQHICPLNKEYADKIYKPTHVNHPCAIWVKSYTENYRFLFDLFQECLKEYEFRFGKVHKTKKLLFDLQLTPLLTIRGNTRTNRHTPPPLCMPDQYKVDDHVQAYRNFYKAEKMFDKNGKPMANWTNREKPRWLINVA